MDTRPDISWLVSQGRYVRIWIFLSIGLAFFIGLLIVLQARLIADIIHGAFLDRLPLESLWPMFFILAVAVVLRAFLQWAREVSGVQAGARIRDRIRWSILSRLAKAGPVGIGERSAGELATVTMEQVEALHGFYADYLPQLVIAFMVPVTLLVFVFPVSWVAGGMLLATAPMIPLFMVLFGLGAESVTQRNFQVLSRMSAHFLDTLQGLGTLKLFGGSRKKTADIAEKSEQYRKQTMRVLRIAFLSSAVLEFFSAFAIALVAIYLGMNFLGYIDFGTYGTSLTFADGLFILILAPDFYLPLRDLGTLHHVRAESIGAAGKIRKLLALPVMNREGLVPHLKEKSPISIRMENVSFGFDDKYRPALSGVDLEIHSGQHLALVGASGAGKTTIGQLLLAFARPDDGKILINGVDLSTLDPELWRKYVSWIGQRPVLFHGTVRENIRMGNPQASEFEFEAAVKAASVNVFTDRFSQGLDTLIGEQGSGISRGQAQQVALARAFLKNAPIVLLDEPTAGLDSESDSKIMDSIFRFCENLTLIFMTHRLGRLQEVDHIVVLAEGKVAEKGTFEQLMRSGGMLSQLLNTVREGSVVPKKS